MYNKFMDEHVRRYGTDKVEQWKEALKTISVIEEKEVFNTGYTAFCENLVRKLLNKLKARRNIEIDSPIGLEDQVQHAMELLDIQSFGVRYVGICGMGGIGKTTLAKDIFHKIVDQFDSSTFLADVRESSRRHGITYVLEKLLNGLGIPTTGREYEQLCAVMKECFWRKKVLIVLDDADDWEQIKKLAGNSSWFGSGSRIIVTTRNRSILETGNGKLSEHEVRDFEMKPLEQDAARQLFNRHAFKEGTPTAGFEELSIEAASLTGGLPLALKIIGSLLYNRKIEIWREVIEKLRSIPESEVKKRLRISYDALLEEHKQIFLDVACFFVGIRTTYPVYMWKACKYCPLSGLEVLSAMSLVKVSDDGKISMHDQLRDLGRDIVREENIIIPAKRSRLWEDDTSRRVLMSKKDKEIVEGVRVDGYCAINLMQAEIGSLENMRFLELQQANLKGDFEDLFPNLKWLSYHCVEDFEVAKFSMKHIVVLDFSNSTIDQSWDGWSQLENAKQLKVLDLTGAKCLTKTPYFPEGIPLERLILDGCRKLEAIDSSIGNLKCLKYFNLDGCVSLTSLPEEIANLENLTEVFLAGDDQSFTLPESFGKLIELRSLTLRCLGITDLPSSFRNLKSLVDLNIQATEIVNLSDSIEGMVKLENLSVVGSDKVQNLPVTLGTMKSLVILDLTYSGLVELPSCVGELPKLKRLSLAQCFIEKLPELLGTIKSLVELDLAFTEIIQLPESIKGLENLEKLSLSNCTKLEALPGTIGDLKSLVELKLSATAITELPESIGGLENLKENSLEHCRGLITLPKTIGALKRLEILKAESVNLSGGLPNEISGLSSLRVLDLSHSQVRELPSSIKELHLLDKLLLFSCDQIQQLPDLPVNLSELNALSRTLVKVPNLSKLQSLTKLALVCGVEIFNSDFGISMLSRLVELRLGHAAVTTLPDEFGNLSKLKTLWLGCPSIENIPHLPPNLEEMFLLRVRQNMDLPNLPDLGKLSYLEVKNWPVDGKLGLHLPEGLRDLYVSDCPRLASLPAISHLKKLRNLHLLRCPSLTEIPGLGKLKRLHYFCIEGCGSLIELENMSELKEIQSVRIVSCRKLRGIEGIDASRISIPGEDSQEMCGDSGHEGISCEHHDISSLLSSPGRDFLVRRNGHQVKIDSLKGKKVWLYLSGSSWDTFDLILMTVYGVFYPEGDFEVVFVSDNLNEESFNGDFGRMPWLAIPYSDLDKRRSIHKLFNTHGHDMPRLLILDQSGRVLTTNGFEIILSKAVLPENPLSPEKIKEF